LTYIAAILTVACFAAVLRFSGITQVAAGAAEHGRHAVRSMRTLGMSDSDKEAIARQASLHLMMDFLSIVVRAVAATAASLLALIAFDVTGLAGWAVVTHMLASWQGIILSSVITMLVYIVSR